MISASHLFSIFLLVFGFGFVIFFHELGHFIAAKAVGIRCDQFAVGFGQALFAWRKGIGFRIGSTTKEYEQKVTEHYKKTMGTPETRPDGSVTSLIYARVPEGVEVTSHPELSSTQFNKAAKELGLGETEYRLNWIPLGGYVKMLGQDDMDVTATSEDPRAFNKKSIGRRMIVVSAGVIMNVILAAIGFMIVFMIGFNAPPPIVGGVLPDSPAQRAGLKVGDRILTIDGHPQYDFTKIALNVALAPQNQPIPLTYQTPDGKVVRTMIEPEKADGESRGFLALGVLQPAELRGGDPKEIIMDEKQKDLVPAETLAVKPGDTIVAVEGKPVAVKDYYVLDRALQTSNGQPIQITVKDGKTGQTRDVAIQPKLQKLFTKDPVNFAGMQLRTEIDSVMEDSPAKDKLLPGDDIVRLDWSNGTKTNPTADDVMSIFNNAGRAGQPVTITVQRGDKQVTIDKLVPSLKVSEDRRGMGVALGYDTRHAVVSDVMPNSPADQAHIAKGYTITAINGQPVANWNEALTNLKSTKPGKVTISFVSDTNKPGKAELDLTQPQIAQLDNYGYTHSLILHDAVEPRQTDNPITAASWGITETRDFILQFYVTIQRMFQGSISPANMMGPVGIFHAGAKFAFKGFAWLLWFLSMISANLAVVNFLPIPIVDGGLFTFLIIEKFRGRPLSPKAMQVAQVVGLAVILGVFLLVTYQDIARMF